MPRILSVLVAFIALAVVAACTSDGMDEVTSTPTDPPAPESSRTPRATATPTPSPTMTPTPTAEPSEAIDPPVPIGLFFEARPTEPDRSVELPVPVSRLPAYDGEHMVLYDTLSGDAREFDRTAAGYFSFDSRYFAWVGAGSLHVLDLTDGTTRVLGPGGAIAGFWDARRLILGQISGHLSPRELLDVETGERETIELDFTTRGEQWRELRNPEITYEVRGQGGQYDVISAAGKVVLEADAQSVRRLSASEILLLTDWRDDRANLFVVNLESREASFVASVSREDSSHHGAWVAMFSGTATHILWTDNFCTGRGPTWLLDRRSGEVTKLNTDLRGGEVLYLDDFGHVVRTHFVSIWQFIDIETLESLAALPDGVVNSDELGVPFPPWARWSLDGRYVSVGFGGGTDGGEPCI